MIEKILILNNDPILLDTYQQRLQKQFCLFTAQGENEGIELLHDEGPFAVIITDFSNPGINKHLLPATKQLSPNSILMILTYSASPQAIIEAVNQFDIFRFLVIPCTPEQLAREIEGALEKYRSEMTEQKRQKNILHGSVKILCEILSLVSPKTFSRALRIRVFVRHIASQLELADMWQYETAAMLSQIGCITLPSNTLDKAYSKDELTEAEKRMFASHPSVGRKLLAHIPYLDKIGCIIERQNQPFNAYPPLRELTGTDYIIAIGAQMLNVTLHFVNLEEQDIFREKALEALSSNEGQFNPKLLTTLAGYKFEKKTSMVRTISIRNLETGMITDDDIKSNNGTLLLSKGSEVTYTALERLRNFSQDGGGIKEPFRVRVVSMNYQNV
ncbi:HD domain-containing phosphohydrolase [Planctomycetota bacterium]